MPRTPRETIRTRRLLTNSNRARCRRRIRPDMATAGSVTAVLAPAVLGAVGADVDGRGLAVVTVFTAVWFLVFTHRFTPNLSPITATRQRSTATTMVGMQRVRFLFPILGR